MSHDDVQTLSNAIKDLRESNDRQFKDLNEKVDPVIRAYSTMTQGSVWLKYIFWFVFGIIGALVGLLTLLSELRGVLRK